MVLPGETLYAVAFRYDQDYRSLAQLNHLSPPYTLFVGQKLSVQPGFSPPRRRQGAVTKPVMAMPLVTSRRGYRQAHVFSPPLSQTWLWPIHGRVVMTYQPKLGRKGIDIAGKKGQKIHAAAEGIVAYAGNGVLGYGNLIIIKHKNQYLTAYGNNSRLFVKEGQQIKANQTIAEIGIVDRRYWGVHFEIRSYGKPMNPLHYLGQGHS